MLTLHSAAAPELFPKTVVVVVFVQEIMILLHSATRLLPQNEHMLH